MFKKPSFWIALFCIALFCFLFRNVDLTKLGNAIVHYNYVWLFPALVVYLAGYIIRGYRWVVLLSPVKKCTFKSLFPTLIIGFMANNILPARAGELVRAHLNGTKEKISRSASLATIILERIFDGLTMIVILTIALQFGNLPKNGLSPGFQTAIHLAPYVFGSLFLILFLLVLFKEKTTQLINLIIGFLPKKLQGPLGNIAHTFIDGLHILKSAKESFIVLLTSIAAWSCEFSAYYLLAFGMNIAPTYMTFLSAGLLMAIVNLAILIPNAPGGIGLFEFVGQQLLIGYGLDGDTGLGFMLLLHFMVLVPITLMGFYFTIRENLSLGAISKETEKAKTPKKTEPAKKKKGEK